jgi:hypothetical protein
MKTVSELNIGEKFSFPGSRNVYTVEAAEKASGRTKAGTKRNAIKLSTSGGTFFCYPNELVNPAN